MTIEIQDAMTLLGICSGLSLVIGVCIRTPPQPAPDEFKAVALHALKQIEDDEAPRFVEWTPAVRSRLYHQEATRRYRVAQLADSRPSTDLAA